MPFHLDTTKHYKIWFSSTPDTFLSMEDQLRFIRMREKNPQAKLGFVYSSAKLSPKAHNALKDFCKKYQITPLDFDTELPSLISDEQDKKLYDQAKKELQLEGGNLAAASDCVRLIIPMIEKFGNYSDFDVTIDFCKKPSLVPVKAPVILPITIDEKCGMILNIDFLAVASTGDEKNILSPEGIKSIRAIQAKVIEKYAAPYKAFTTAVVPGTETVISAEPFCLMVLDPIFTRNPNTSIFDLRKYLLSSKTTYSFLIRKENIVQEVNVTSEASNMLRHSLYRQSVISFSGASAYYAIFSDTFPKEGFTNAQDGMLPAANWKMFLTAMTNSSLSANALSETVTSKNDLQSGRNSEAHNITQGLRDASWIPLGKQKKAERDQKTFSAARTIANFWHKKKPAKTGTGRVARLLASAYAGESVTMRSREGREFINSEVAKLPKRMPK